MKRFKQFRYFGDNHPDNSPLNITQEKLMTGTVFEGVYPIISIGVQTLPGTKFYINSAVDGNGVIVGSTGIFQINYDNVRITSLKFDGVSLNKLNNFFKENRSATGLMVDVVYEEDEE